MSDRKCDIFWGSHGCDLPHGHHGQHYCIGCCDGSEPSHQRLHDEADPNQYGVNGCAGTWPYYGRDAMASGRGSLKFFHYSAENGWQFQEDANEFVRLEEIHAQATR